MELTSSAKLRWPSAAAAVDQPVRRAFSDFLPRAVGVTWALVMAWVLFVAARDQHPVFTSRHECGSDPADILRSGELLEESTLRFIITAHCANALYLPDERIALRYGGGTVDVETRRFSIGGATHYKIVSVGNEATP
jgi:hypothetical protein